jgi:ABC transport system ATP-binding/permease protein
MKSGFNRAMSILLSAQNLEKSFGSQTLFRSLSFGIESGDRIGLIGPNGAGKSTLLKILAGLTDHDGGDIARSRGLTIGYLEQSPVFGEDQSVFDVVSEAAGDDPQKFGRVHEWMARLGLNQGDVNEATPVSSLSGGWKKRVALARELAREPGLLLLDEPTNHLDLESILWLEEFIQSAPYAVMTITHDRMFLQRIANRIFDLDRKNPDGLFVIKGSYADFLEAKDAMLSAQAKREEIVKNTLRRETEWLRRGAKARTTKQQSRIDRAGHLADEAEDLRSRNLTRRAQIDFQSAERNPQKLIEAKEIVKSYGKRKLFGPLDLLIGPKSRLGLLGANGSGKTTLIRVLLGDEKPDQGSVRQAEKLQAAYFAQTRDELDPKKSVLRTLCPEGDYVDYRGQFVFARSYLDRFLFRGEQMDMPVEKLSGGEKARLRIAQLMLTKANVLILDEPTNDLDMATLGVLEDSLKEFDGAVILVTHDRYFLDQVANEILAFTVNEEGEASLERFADTLQWEGWLASRPKKSSKKAVADLAPQVESADNAKPAPKKKLSFKDKHELENMESTISQAESRLSELQRESQKAENLANAANLTEIYAEIAQLETRIEELYKRWSELEG